jgi:anionic cell wall polymer biosynthesis LytR-Cps2A-Psr (LCP) family protein
MKRKIILALAGILLIIIIALYLIINPYYHFLTDTLKVSPLKTALGLEKIDTVNDQVNIVILGIGGGTHDGPNLTDSIIVTNYNFATNTLSTVGIPRDVWDDTLRDKINSAYAYGEAKQPGGGLKLAKAEIGAVVGLPVTYGVVISFDKFKQIIDYFGGVDIVVEHSFTDHEYPIDGKEDDPCGGDPNYACRYETITFEKGPIHLDGTTALKFTRSRHAEGSEGSDFARSRRQQIVMAALKDKVMAILKKHDVKELTNMYNAINPLIERDISNQEAAVIGRNIVTKKNFTQNNIAIPRNYFTVPAISVYGTYTLTPPDNNFDELHQFIQCALKDGDKKCAKSEDE